MNCKINAVVLTIFAILSGCFLPGCASKQPHGEPHSAAVKHETSPPPAQDAKERLSQLVLGHGDKISIEIVNQDKLKTELTVDASGAAILPLIGDVLVAGRDVQALRQELTERYARYLREPQVIIKVESTASRRYAVLGEVKNAGLFPVDMPLTISEALAKAGGIGSEGLASAVLLVRRTGTDGQVTRIDMESIQQAGLFAADAEIKHGDIIFVPKKGLSITADFMNKLGTILSPVLSLERAVTLWPSMLDALNGSGETAKSGLIIGN
jgi:polysaccharide export outer membrane protein